MSSDGCVPCPGTQGCQCDLRTPTVTPAAGDLLGRPVFLTGVDGRCRLVVEGKTGASGLDPSSGTHPTSPPAADGRPDLQIEVSNKMGNGDTAVDCTSSPNLDGIPAVEPPDFGPGQTITDALLDVSCRFAGNSVNAPCLLRSDGSAALGKPEESPTVQYCDDVSHGQRFLIGKNVVTVRLRDAAMNLGPPYQIVIQVP